MSKVVPPHLVSLNIGVGAYKKLQAVVLIFSNNAKDVTSLGILIESLFFYSVLP